MAIDYQEIGRRIARRRRFLGLRQAEVCEQCGINSNYLSNIEHAKSIPSIDVLLRICDALHTTPDALLLGVQLAADHDATALQTAQRVQAFQGAKLSLLNAFLDWLQNTDFPDPSAEI